MIVMDERPMTQPKRTIGGVALVLFTVTSFASGQVEKSKAPDIRGLGDQKKTITTDTGKPVGDNQNSLTAGPAGPTLLEDFHLIEKIARFDRERIPERVVHARGAGVHGEFVSYADQSQWTKADFLSEKGKKTPVFARFSIVVLPKGAADTSRDVRGFAVKFYTEEGNYDLVGNDIPVFFIRDAMKFPDLVHSLKPSPVSNVQESERFFDFFAANPETTHMLTFLFADQGTPASFREMNGFGVHAFKWVNVKGDVHYLKYHWKSMQGVRNYTDEEAKAAGAQEPASLTKELYDTINAGKFPSWELQVQLVKPADLKKFDFNPLDATKDWPESIVPRQPVGKMTLNKVPDNFFQSTEQVAFNTGAYVPGIEPSEDKLLQGRNFSYSDTQRHRLGANYQQLPINQPRVPVRNENQEGLDDHGHTKGDINYAPSLKQSNISMADPKYKEGKQTQAEGKISQEPISDPKNFSQAGERYRALSVMDRDHLIHNLTLELKKVKTRAIVEKIASNFYLADADFGKRVADANGVDMDVIKKLAEK